jgi:DNA polymerase III sliding clamp (beta) subunit (PCNA family)
MARPIFTSALLALTGETVSMSTTDGHRLTHATARLSHGLGALLVCVPADALKALLLLPDSEVSVTLSNARGAATCGLYTLDWQMVDGTWPDVSKVLNPATTDATLVRSADLQHSLTLADVFDDPKSRLVRVRIWADGVRVRTDSPDTGDIQVETELVEWFPTGENVVEFAANLRYLQDTLTGSERVMVRTSSPYPARTYVVIDEEGHVGRSVRHVIAPMQFT